MATLILGAALLGGCAADLAETPPARRTSNSPASATPSAVHVVHPRPAASDDTYPTSLYLEHDVELTARRDGVIEKVLVDRGERVAAGALLAMLETDIAASEVEIADADTRLAQAEFDRVRSLRDQKVVSEQEFLKAEIARDQAKSRAALARARLDRCAIRAPFDGVIVERRAVVGRRVLEDDGYPLFRLAAKEPLRARVDLPEGSLPGLGAGSRAEILEAGSESPRPAKVVFVGPVIDAGSGTAPVIVELEDRSAPLRPGASVTVRFASTAPAPALMRIPSESIRSGAAPAGSEASVFIEKGGRVEARKVRVVRREGGDCLVEGPLGIDDRVIVGAGASLSEGDAVIAREGL